ncbi:uncharacterized protein LOC114356258 [Ostrinia furnacalis]|uniref:uncharacterized protein LOC114356258 n=1 Tax=Ostrinia furnacalis TaxID=93504 RepID=UPI00103EB465|nr:uncharacterized protein LOC114356258 [Ostrinia furnacalis]
MKQINKRVRAKSKMREPQTLAEINVPDDLKNINGELFLVSNENWKENEKVMIFCKRNNLIKLKDSLVWIMDGTFQTCPFIFAQLYSIHGLIGSGDNTRAVPLVYAFLSKKSQECYVHFFTELKRYADSIFDFNENEDTFAPPIVLTDFELAVINAVRVVFPGTVHKCCLFHLGQNVWRRVQEYGLQQKYVEDGEFSLKIIALAYLPPIEIPSVFALLKENVFPTDDTRIVEWFETNYVNGKLISRNTGDSKLTIRRTVPLFPTELWLVHQNNISNLPRTQNKIEAWHRRWNSLMDNKKMGLYTTIGELKKEQAATNLTIARMESGVPATPPRKKKRMHQEAISRFLERRDDSMDVFQFLKGIASSSFL